MDLVDARLLLATAQMSVRRFEEEKDNPDYREGFKKTSLYIIAKRPVQIMEIVSDDELGAFLDGINNELQNVTIGTAQQVIQDWDVDDLFNEFTNLIRNRTIVPLKISQAGEANQIHGFFKLPDEVDYVTFKDCLSEISFEDLLYYASQGAGVFYTRDDMIPFLTYYVLYVGQCVKEGLVKRFQTHHALQSMLIKERVISKEYSNSDELVILPFFSESNTISMLSGESTQEEYDRAFLNEFSYGSIEVNLDAEKALVHGMDPKYNKIKFKSYPKSKDGLYGSEAELYCYSFANNLILKYGSGVIYGAGDSVYASRIVADREDKTVTVYEPGKNCTDKIIGRFFSQAWKTCYESEDGEPK